ncbi:hypothetical protein [Xenorhabdus szentirmaii]|uniref:Uncharacterized protein n=2 Tax=Xenorhabdus szentirmaii TaxID=290112 RepID=W1IVY7_9GAMM|nr:MULTISPECIES: hypothetical protein [Xenorhabdus]MBD2780562.1 hypothetical protein [Xenorhabdus sp. 38]MBD2792996.1 hypothetical protein [Xenorhabdus sp. CUL]MBD2801822.1 hypothetical protein [Xenorhabdus sp. M]MBD2805621.1 hypothetical protein [Xenorhabdus sp. ZM]MBD2820837.1 hypothetical protein [Xenorhabdus sp. 42]
MPTQIIYNRTNFDFKIKIYTNMEEVKPHLESDLPKNHYIILPFPADNSKVMTGITLSSYPTGMELKYFTSTIESDSIFRILQKPLLYIYQTNIDEPNNPVFSFYLSYSATS